MKNYRQALYPRVIKKKMNGLKLKNSFFIYFFFFCCLIFNSCFPKKQKSLLINGAGASFPYILYSKWLSEYRNVDPLVAINYQSIGSGGGIRQFITGTLDFGGTDVPVSEEDKKSTKKQILHIPTALGAVAVTYKLNLSSGKTLQFDADVLSKIFRGKIKKWNDPQIKNLNKDLQLPEQDIVVVYRADGSGTTSFFTKYLSLLSKDFLKEVGKGKSVAWPVGVGGKGNEGVMGLVSRIEGSIAYIGVSYAISQKLPMAAIKNKAGQFKKATLESIKASADQSMKKNKNFTSSLIYIDGKNSYPLSGFTYIIISKKMPEKKGKAIVKFLKWVLKDGQKYSEPLHFVSLPKTVIQSALNQISQVEFE